MNREKVHWSPALWEVIHRAMAALHRARGAPHAIGGAVALYAHGIVRETKDLDIFLTEANVRRIFGAFRKGGFEVVSWAPPYHFAAILPKYRRYLPDYRVDLMVTVIPTEVSAIESPVSVRFAGRKERFFPATELAASKYLVGDPKNLLDVQNLIRYGLTSPSEVRASLESVTDTDAREFSSWWSAVREAEMRRQHERQVLRKGLPGGFRR